MKPADLDWNEIEASLWRRGYARLPPLLTATACAALVALYARRELFRSRIEMPRYRFGVGDYQYFDYPLPEIVRDLRERSYAPLAAGQHKATPLLLHYEAGGYNCLHQDL